MFSASKTAAPSGYNLQRSVRLRSSASAYFNRSTWTSANRTTWTASIWIKRGILSSLQTIMGSYDGVSANASKLYFTSGDALAFDFGGASANTITTSAVFRDPSSWYHIVLAIDTTQATAANRIGIYVNGVQQTTTGTPVAQNTNTLFWVTSNNAYFGLRSADYLDGYLAEINVVNGQQLTPTSFGAYNANTGVWQPKAYTGTYGTNGFYLNFNDNSAATAAAIGKDSSGNGNNWTPNNISVTAGVTYDSMLDVPTLTSATNSNFCVLNPLDKGTSLTVQAANLQTTIGATHNGVRGTFQIPTTGKWYWEVTVTTTTTNSIIASFGLATAAASLNTYDSNTTGTYSLYCQGSPALVYVTNGSSGTTFGSPVTGGTVCNVAYDADNGQLYLGIANTYYSSAGAGTGNPSTATNPSMAVAASLGLFPYVHLYSNTIDINFGQRPFSYTPPTGFNRLNTYNLSTPTIPNGATQFAATKYTGNGSSQSISNATNNTLGITFQPDFFWVKDRTAANQHVLQDTVRGSFVLVSNSTGAEFSNANYITAYNSNGFTVGSSASVNTNADALVAWQWKASNASAVSNTSGSITSQVSANPTAGFSIVTYTGTGANATVGHGLGVAPKMVIVKLRSGVNSWGVYHIGLTSAAYWIPLDLTNAQLNNAALWNSAAPTSSVFSVGSASISNASTGTMVAYCFSPIAGYSAFGSYTGNGSADGPFVYLGFRPRWIMIKRTDSTSDWYIWDTSRDTYNVEAATLLADSAAAETSATSIDDLSNGFKCRSATVVNVSTGTYIYAAFAENPFNYSLAR